MCTVTWLHHGDGGFDLLCNRDEARTREMARPPAAATRNGVRYLAPADGRHHGAWIAANEFGLALCLTNGVRGGHGAHAPADMSRGLLVLDWIDARSAAEVLERAASAEQNLLPRYAPFRMAVLVPGVGAALIEWDGARVRLFPDGDPFVPLSSSSAAPDAADAARRALFQHMNPADPAALQRFHQSHNPEPGALSCCMHRADAHTVSFSWLRVDAQSVDLFYAPGTPCEARNGVRATLARKDAA